MGVYFSSEEILDLNIKIEEQEENYYRTFAKRTENVKVKEIFTFLANEEVKHRTVFRGFQEKYGDKEFITPLDNEEVSGYLRALVDSRIFSDPEGAINNAKNAKDEIEAIDRALTFEKDTILFFIEIGKFMKDDQKHVIQKLIDEERSHIEKLVEVKKSL